MMLEETAEKNVLPEEISNLSFQELHELENKCGSKIFSKFLAGEEVGKHNREFKRENKNRPREMSSKIPPFKHLTPARENKPKPEKQMKPRDPRFHSSFGTFDQEKFQENYKFLNNVKKKEKKILKKKLKNPELDDEGRNKINMLLQRMDNQRREEIRKKKESELKTEERQYEIDQLKQGYKPEYCKKSDEKLLNLVRKFETMKETGGLQKHIKRRRKKSIGKDKQKLSLINST